jgi:hypothetical protein
MFDKTTGTNTLQRSGSCSGHSADLYLNSKGIEFLPAGVFDSIAPLWVFVEMCLVPYMIFLPPMTVCVCDAGSFLFLNDNQIHAIKVGVLPSGVKWVPSDTAYIGDSPACSNFRAGRHIWLYNNPIEVIEASALPSSLTWARSLCPCLDEPYREPALRSSWRWAVLAETSISGVDNGCRPAPLAA